MQRPKDLGLIRSWQHPNGDHGLTRVNVMDFEAIHNVAMVSVLLEMIAVYLFVQIVAERV